MIDTHTHLYFDWYDDDREAVIKRMTEAGIDATISIAIDLPTAKLVDEQTRRYPFIYGAFGIHPTDCTGITDDDIGVIRTLLQENEKAVAVGEVGLDYYHKRTDADTQQEMFRKMIRLAKEVHKPLIIHNREADNDVYRILKEEHAENVGGVFHCFAGDVEMARKVIDLGFYISFTGNVTFKNFRQRDVVEYVPMERLLLETDAPFLTPVPFRGKRNEPAYVRYVAEKIAEMKGISTSDVVSQTDKNAYDLFGINV